MMKTTLLALQGSTPTDYAFYKRRNHIWSVSWMILIGVISSVPLAKAEEVPNAGTLQQQIKPTLPASPSNVVTPLSEPKENQIEDNAPFNVNQISIEGNQRIETEVLHDLIKEFEHGQHTLRALQQACKRITDYYRSQGYPLARAVLPAQEITEGKVRILVIEAKIGSVNIQNNSAVRTSLVEGVLAQLKSGDTVAQKPLDRALLLLSDLPGVSTNANVKPGQAVGESDFDVNLQDSGRLTARAGLDSFGNKYTDRLRASGTLSINNPLHSGDVLSLNFLTTGDRMQYTQLNYDAIINSMGTHLGGAYGYLHYKLGDSIKKLDAHGTSENGELWVKHPILRGRANNLYVNLRYQHNVLKDHTDASNIKLDRTLDNVVLGVNGDLRDGYLGGGINSYQLLYTDGRLDFDNAKAKASNAVTTDTEGHFSKWNYNLNRLQTLNDRLQVWASVSGQVAQNNLDASQKMVFGGPYSVRAYDNGTVSGDNGTLVTLEARYFVGNWHGAWQGIAFYDAGSVEVNEKNWAGNTGKNKAHLSGAGLGINWFGPEQLQARAFMATSIGNQNTLTKSGDNSIGWVEIAKYF